MAEADTEPWTAVDGDAAILARATRAMIPAGPVLREIPGRRVFRVDAEGASFVVKHFWPAGIENLVRDLFRGPPAGREWGTLQEARRRGLPVPRPLAWGRRGRESVLVTEWVEGAVPFRRFISGRPETDLASRRAAIRRAGAAVRAGHEAGVYHRDLHAGNLVVGGDGAVVVTDLYGAAFRDAPSPRLRLKNLAALEGASGGLPATDRFRFLRGYAMVSPPLARAELKAIARHAAARAVEAVSKRRRRGRLLRCLRDGGEFARLERPPFAGMARRTALAGPLASILADPRALFSHPAGRRVKEGAATAVSICPSPAGELAVKRYLPRRGLALLRDLLRGLRARRAWIAGNALHLRGICVPEPLAFLELRGLPREAYLVTRAVAAERITDFFRGLEGAPPAGRGDFIRGLARFVRTLHDAGASCRDLKETNLLVRREGEGGRLRFYLVDFDGVRFGPVGFRPRARDLARLARAFRDRSRARRTDFLRFLRGYLGPFRRDEWRAFWGRAASRIERRPP